MKNISNFLFIAFVFISGCENGSLDNRVITYNGRPLNHNGIELYGHRGARGLYPEQTMPAYAAALSIGVDYVDMDLGITRDGVLVITHDLGLNPDITRDKDGNWIREATPIHSMTLQEVQSYNVGMIKPGTAYASYFPDQKPVDAYIPTLEEVVDYVISVAGDRVGFQFEIKNDPSKPQLTVSPYEFAAAVSKFIEEKGIIDRTEVQAFDWQCLIELKKLNSNIKTAALSDHTTEVMDDTETGLWIAGLKPADFDYSLPKMVKHINADCWEPFQVDLTAKDLQTARDLGLKVVVWGWPEKEKTDYNTDMMQKMIDWKVDGIISDRPDRLREILALNGYEVPRSLQAQ